MIEDATPYTIDGTARCAAKFLLIVDLPSDVISYKASVDQPGVGPFDFSGPPFTNPITGFGNPYRVPTARPAGSWRRLGSRAVRAPTRREVHPHQGVWCGAGQRRAPRRAGGGGGGSANCVVPKVVGSTLTVTGRAIARADCRVGKLQYSKTTGPAGLVLLTTPKAG